MEVCKVCGSKVAPHCSTQVLGKYDVTYYQCTACELIAPETPYWLDEAYSSAITRLDIGLIIRNELMVSATQAVIKSWFNRKARFIDYGGGYGILVRMMRDRGFDYYRQDIHCENLFAESFDVADTPGFKAELLTAFEVFEHLVDPVSEIQKMLELSDSILFSTTVQPSPDVTPASWWYYIPETGQHVSLYSRKSLQALANRFGLNYYWNEQNLHLFTPKKISSAWFRAITHPQLGKIYNLINRQSTTLLTTDFDKINTTKVIS